MNINELSKEDQELINKDFGVELEKDAAAEAGVAKEMYSTGFENLAPETADEFDKIAMDMMEEKKKDHKKDGDDDDKKGDDYEKKMDDESEKKASGMASFIERGAYDGLRKLGSDRYQDENHYFYPYISEKLAEQGKEDEAAKIEAKFLSKYESK